MPGMTCLFGTVRVKTILSTNSPAPDRGQVNPERRSGSRRRHYFNLSAVLTDRPLRDREPQPRPTRFARARFLDSIEAVENFNGVFGCDAGTGVRYLKLHATGGVPSDMHGNRATGRRELHRVM